MAYRLSDVTPDSKTPTVDEPDGAFLDKSAGIPGSPVQSGIRNDQWYFFSKIMDITGTLFNNIQDTITSSQLFTAFAEFLKPIFQTISVDGLLTISNFRHMVFELDTALGNRPVELPPAPAFEGQTIEFTVSDTGLGYIDFGGSYDLVVSLNRVDLDPSAKSLKAGVKGVNGEWVPFGGVSARYVQSGQKIAMNTNRSMELILSLNITTSTLISGYFGSGSGNSYFGTSVATLAIQFVGSIFVSQSVFANLVSSRVSAITTAEITINGFSATSGLSGSVDTVLMGEYA